MIYETLRIDRETKQRIDEMRRTGENYTDFLERLMNAYKRGEQNILVNYSERDV